MPTSIYFTPDCDCTDLFERFFYDWNPRFFRLVIKYVPHFDLDLAKDICQQVWLEVWQGIQNQTLKYLTPGLLVYRADSRIKDHYRKAARFPQFDLAHHDRADGLNLDERIDYQTVIGTLPDDRRTVVTLFFREGLTQAEIAEELAISTRTVRRQLESAVTHCRDFLQTQPVAK